MKKAKKSIKSSENLFQPTYVLSVSCIAGVFSSARNQAAYIKGKWWDNLHAIALRIFGQSDKSRTGNVFHLLRHQSSLLNRDVVLATDSDHKMKHR